MPLKHLGNFWNSLNIALINCEVFLALSWSANFVITSMEKRLIRAAQGGNSPVYGDFPKSAAFKIKEQSNGINIYQKCLIRLKITI